MKAGLLDEFPLTIAPVLLGEVVRLFDHLGSTPIHLERLRTVESRGANHLSFRVLKQDRACRLSRAMGARDRGQQ